MFAVRFPHALILTGPTGSGKSHLAVELAERLGAEIVSMDSMALYRHMDIGTAKPQAADRARVPHHLLDVLEPSDSASVAWWLGQATAAYHEIAARGKQVLFVGGTPLYLKALLHGLFDGPRGDDALRKRLSDEAEQLGVQALHDRLQRVDPISAARLHPNDLHRVLRALEVWELTGQPISALQMQWSKKSQLEEQPDYCLCLDVARTELYARIDARALQMIADGLVEEVRSLRSLARPLSREASQALGYKEMFAYVDGKATLEETVACIQKRSRNFAKRQLTWFRHLPECRMVTPDLTFAHWQSRMDRGNPDRGRGE
jgi:tRNA dimethylallyltransferase